MGYYMKTGDLVFCSCNSLHIKTNNIRILCEDIGTFRLGRRNMINEKIYYNENETLCFKIENLKLAKITDVSQMRF